MLFNHEVNAGRIWAAGKVAKVAGMAAACVLAAFLSVSCAGFAGLKNGETTPPERSAEKPPAPAEGHYQEEKALFKELPSGIRAYLLKLSAAFAGHDAAFLIAQGEDGYEKAVRNSVYDDEYLAMLYRAGIYADDALWQSPEELDLDHVVYIDYTAWREQGPVLGVDGNIYMDGGRLINFSMKVLWRLDEPKILGVYP
ncbi:MAG: hypothetical protein LBO04_03395 [Spirochaetaceae bacterium]|jgi:hypothetical protein|nr:hypothetical protein [Spirochaetaceae bacterium]